MEPVQEMIPAVVVAIKPMSLASKLQSAAMAKSGLALRTAGIADEECYEDEEGNTVQCKKCTENMGKKKMSNNKYIGMQEKALIVRFLKSINEKNYAQAHKYLKAVMETKLASRIAKNKGVKLF